MLRAVTGGVDDLDQTTLHTLAPSAVRRSAPTFDRAGRT
jgi:hypothetical protein